MALFSKVRITGWTFFLGLAGYKIMERKIQLPPRWCSPICTNSMNDVCVEKCSIERDCSWFEVKPDLTLEDLPRFPLKEAKFMTKAEKFTSVVVYLDQVVKHLKGEGDGKDLHYPPSRRISPNLKKQTVLFSAEKRNSPHTVGKECENSGDGFKKVDSEKEIRRA